MEIKRVQKKMNWSAEDKARHKAVREKFASKPTMEELLASGEYIGPIPHGVFLQAKLLLHDLKKAREAAGLSLADAAQRSGIDKAALSRLELLQILPDLLRGQARQALLRRQRL